MAFPSTICAISTTIDEFIGTLLPTAKVDANDALILSYKHTPANPVPAKGSPVTGTSFNLTPLSDESIKAALKISTKYAPGTIEEENLLHFGASALFEAKGPLAEYAQSVGLQIFAVHTAIGWWQYLFHDIASEFPDRQALKISYDNLMELLTEGLALLYEQSISETAEQFAQTLGRDWGMIDLPVNFKFDRSKTARSISVPKVMNISVRRENSFYIVEH